MKFLKKSHVLNLTLKERRVGSKVKSLTIFSYFGAALVVLVLVLSYVWVRLEVIKTGYDILKLREQRDRLVNINKHLEVELMSMASLKAVEEKGKQMQLLAPSKDRIVFMVEPEAETFWGGLENLAEKMNPFHAKDKKTEYNQLAKQGE